MSSISGELQDWHMYVREWRLHLRLTQREVADRIGCSTSFVQLMERGKLSSPRGELLPKLANALGISEDDLRRSPPRATRHASQQSGMRAPKGQVSQQRLPTDILQTMRAMQRDMSDLQRGIDGLHRVVGTLRSTVEEHYLRVLYNLPHNIPAEPFSPFTPEQALRRIREVGTLRPQDLLQAHQMDMSMSMTSAQDTGASASSLHQAQAQGEPSDEGSPAVAQTMWQRLSVTQTVKSVVDPETAMLLLRSEQDRAEFFQRLGTGQEGEIVIEAGRGFRILANQRGEAARALATYEALDGTRCLLLDGISEVMIPITVHRQRADALVGAGRLSQVDADRIVTAREERQRALLQQFRRMRYDIFDLCPRRAITRLVEERVPALDDDFAQLGNLLTDQQIIAILDNVIECLDLYPTYRFGFLRDNMEGVLANKAYWFVKEGHALVLEQGADVMHLYDAYEVTDPGWVYVFRRYFFSELWERLPKRNKSREDVRAFLNQQRGRVQRRLRRTGHSSTLEG